MAKISVLLTEAEDARFGAYCDQKGYKKSTLIARLIRDYLVKEGYSVQEKLFTEALPRRQLLERLPGSNE